MGTEKKLPLYLQLAGAVLIVVGAFLPWATLGDQEETGLDSDGALTLVFGLVIAAVGIYALLGRELRRWMVLLPLVLAAVTVVLAVMDVLDVMDVDYDVGIGLWLTLLGGIAADVGSFLVLRGARAVSTA